MIFWWSDLRFAVNGQRWADNSSGGQYIDYASIENYDIQDDYARQDTNQKPVCDDTKRVAFEMQGQTFKIFHVDCQGYDIDGTLIFEELQDTDLKPSPNQYPMWSYKDDQNTRAEIWATCNDFYHCPRCHMCARKTITTNTVSIVEDAFGTYIQSPKAGVTSSPRVI